MKALFSLLLVGFAIAIVAQPTDAGAQASRTMPAPQIPHASKRCAPVQPGSHEKYHLAPTATLPDGVSFASDWARAPTGGWFGQQIMDSCRMQPDGFLTWHGRAAVRVEVQPNDDPLALNANSERAEMLLMQDASGKEIKENSKGGTQYYATSYYFPTTWQGQQFPWSAFPSIDCSTGDQNKCNSWSFVWQFYGWGALTAAQTFLNGPQRYLFNGSQFADGGLIQLGKWTDFVFMVDWNLGAYAVWRRHEGETIFTLALSGRAAVPVERDVYVKQGLYRGGNVGGRTDILWIGPTVRGSSFSSAEQQAFGTDNGQSSKGPSSPR
jgi:hypothetical protein